MTAEEALERARKELGGSDSNGDKDNN